MEPERDAVLGYEKTQKDVLLTDNKQNSHFLKL